MSREQADEKLARACQAGVSVFLEEGFSIGSITKTDFSTITEENEKFRSVSLAYTQTDGWMNSDAQAKCLFVEEAGFLGMSYSASLHQLAVNDRVYGKKGSEILGSYDEILRMTQAVEKVLMP